MLRMDDRPAEEIAKARFDADTARHEMTILHDDGFYRHLRCQIPGSWTYGFDIVTWPGYLYVGGDTEDFVFARCPDMFEWFWGGHKDSRGGINPHYWSQKLQGSPQRRSGGERYTERAFRETILEWARIQLEEYGEEEVMYPSLLIEALEREVLSGIPSDEQEARDIIDDHHWLFGETWEWSLREYDLWFLWACWAVVWGIGEYRVQKTIEATV